MIVRSDNNIAYDNVMTPIYNDRVIADGGTIETLTEVEEVLSDLGDQDVVPSLLWVAEGSKVGKDYSILPNDGSGDFSVTRPGDTAFTQNPDLTWRPALPNEPRFTYENGVKGRLVENAATRLNTHPLSFENAAWTKSGLTVDTNSGAGYDCPFVDANGINTKQGRKLVATANNGSVKLTTPVAVTDASQYVNSVYIKRLVGTGTIYLVDVNNTDRAVIVTSEWTRVQYAAAAAGTTGQLGIKMATAGDEVMVCYMPIEAGTVATSPIGGAEGSTQTRNADVEVTDGVTEVTQMVVTDTNDNEVVIVVGSPNFTIPTGEIKHIVGTPDDVDVDYYGVEINSAQSDYTLTRVGNAGLHRSLPIQNNIYACILADNGVEAYKLNPNNWAEKLTGGASKLDGTDGQVMIYLPGFWYKIEIDGTKERRLISGFELPGFAYSKPEYLSAYKASLMRSTLKLSSVKNTTTDYRGGGNQSAWDALAQTQLGMPVTNLSRTNFRTYARNRGTGWEAYNYHAWWKMFILFTIEYATLNSQAAVNSALDANGFKQGGLGNGVTYVNYTKWNHLFSYYPLIPNGASDSLASGTGEVTYTLPFEFDVLPPTFVDIYSAATPYTVGQYISYNNLLYKCKLNSTGNLPTNTTYWVQTNLYKGVYDAGTTYQPDDYFSSGALLYRCILESTGNAVTNTTYFVAVTRSTTKVNRYRGVEMPFGHIWDWCEGVNIRAAANSDADPTHKVYMSDNPTDWNDSNYTNYTLIGELPRNDGYIKQMIPGHFLPLVAGGTGAGSSAYWCDYFYQSIPASGVALRGLLLGAHALYGAAAGLGYSSTFYVPAAVNSAFGSRLCYKPSV